MPGYVIHLAIAQEYLKKHKKEYSKDFIKGNIFPDFTDDKSKTHYGKSPAYTSLEKYLSQNNLETDFDKGYFMHLVADYLFYNKYLKNIEKPQIYDDYDYTNKTIIDKYNIIVPDEVKNMISFKNGIPKNFTFDLIYKIIDEISNLDIDIIEQEVKEKKEKWNKYKKLV